MKFETSRLLHGGDYNPEQWLDRPDILEKDIRLFKQAGCNTVSVGIFSWSTLEPREGEYHFDWLRQIIDRLYANGISVILATPSGARPKWLADRYPEVLRVDGQRRRQLFGGRHNHCLTSPIYREKVRAINTKLSEAFGRHPGVILWHISNEYGGECHCPLCQDAFRAWLAARYGTIEELNARWSTTFWSHTYSSFEEIESPSPIGEGGLHALNLDWNRFVSFQTADFLRQEVRAVRSASDLPVTANFMYYYPQLDYHVLEQELDVVSWDTYPAWHKYPDAQVARDNGFWHDAMRSLKDAPFLQMESCPTATNWQGVSKLKKPGLLQAQGLQAIAHGADGALYFQMRQSRGASEKFHGAVIDHYGEADTRVFGEVAGTGEALEKLSALCGTRMESEAVILYDWSSNWAMNDSQGPRNDGLPFRELLMHAYAGLRRAGIGVDVKDESADLSAYRIAILPMTYQFREGFAEKLRAFVEGGGILLTTFWSGVADDTDRCWLGGRPHGLTDVLGLRAEEIDGLYDWEENALVPARKESPWQGRYACTKLCELPVVTGADTLMVYADDFYAGRAALTVNRYGKGEAWYLAANVQEQFFLDWTGRIAAAHGLGLAQRLGQKEGLFAEGLEVTERIGADARYLIYQNFGTAPAALPLPEEAWEPVFGDVCAPLPVYGTAVIAVPAKRRK